MDRAATADASIEAGVDDIAHWPGDAGQARRSVSVLPAMVERLEAGLDEVAGVPAWSMDETELPDTLGRIATVQARLDELSSRIVDVAENMNLPRQAGKTSTTAWLAAVAGTGKREASRLVSLTRSLTSERSEEHTSELQSRGHLVC